MTGTIKVEVDEALAAEFRKKAVERYGNEEGAMSKALEEAMRRYSASARADWATLEGTLKSDKDSVWLQHHAWGKVD